MKKLLFGLIATVFFSFNAYTKTSSIIPIKIDNLLISKLIIEKNNEYSSCTYCGDTSFGTICVTAKTCEKAKAILISAMK